MTDGCPEFRKYIEEITGGRADEFMDEVRRFLPKSKEMRKQRVVTRKKNDGSE